MSDDLERLLGPMTQLVVVIFLAFFFFELLVELVLNELNIGYVQRRRSGQMIPDSFHGKIDSQQMERSVSYTLAIDRFQRWATLYGALATLLVLFGGALPVAEQLSAQLGSLFPPSLHANGILFCLGTGFVVSVLNLPTELYSTFVIEQRFGFNRTPFGLYLADKLKGLVLAILIGGPFLFCILWVMRGTGTSWWIWAFFFIFGFQLLMLVLYPALIAPLFNRFYPLEPGELREQISSLARQVGLKTSGIYTMDGSKRSAHSNAYFTGMGKSKRIVLFDTLLKQLNTEQLLAVLAHEIGHYKLKHIRRSLVLRGAFLLTALFVLSLLVDYPPFFHAFGLQEPTHHSALVLFTFLAGPFTFYLNPLFNHLSRRYEYEADAFAAEISNNAQALGEALIELTVQNLSNLTPHPWYSAYHYSHPTTEERIRAMAAMGKKLAQT